MEEYYWLITCSMLVFVMQAGFLCLESGRIRSKNSINVAAKNIADFLISVAVFWMVGFAFMFGNSANQLGLIGLSNFFFAETNSSWNVSFFLFQMMFCGTAITIVSGAVAERMTFNGYLIAALILSTVIYPISGHWAWAGFLNKDNQGWLEALGFIDFAGSMVVHGVGGCVSLVAVMLIGARRGRFSSDQLLPQGSNLPFSALGVLLIWFGWFGFNGGSTLLFNAHVPIVLLNTCLAAAWGGIATTAIAYQRHKFVDVTCLLNGIVGGLVAITASCFAVTAFDSAIIGITAGALVFYGEQWLEHLKIDDAIGVIPAHLLCGIWGTLSVGIFADLTTLNTGLSRISQIGIQLLGVVAIAAWAIAISYILLRLINRYVPLRVTNESEIIGMNVSEHNSATELLELLTSMKQQQNLGDFSTPVPEEPFTEVGVVAHQYNQVIAKVRSEILARDQAITNFRDSERRKSAILDSSMDCILTIDDNGKILEFNPAAERTFDCSKRYALENNFIQLFVPKEQASYVKRSLEHEFSTHDGLLINRRNSLNLTRKSGSEFPAEISVTGSNTSHHQYKEYTLNIRDVTRQKKLQAKLRQLAYSDPLTGLYNRTYLIENLKRALKNATPDDSLIVYFLDLDRFKRINDTLGHKAGDGLLCEVASRLSRVTRETDIISRWGGDEFIIMMRGHLTQEFARQKAEEILIVMREPVEVEGYSLNIPTSLGIAYQHTVANETTADKLIQHADIAMYEAKIKGRDNYQFYSPQLEKFNSSNFQMEAELKEDLYTERFFILFQPKVNRNREIIGLEALSRWNHKEQGFIPPNQFIALAEESPLIFELGEQVIIRCLDQMREWRDHNKKLVPLAINISGQHLISAQFLPFLQAQLLRVGISGHLIEIEITESVLVSDIERCINVMSQLKTLGVTISVDDFGTGYSSLNYLKRLPLDVLKIDKSFVDECADVREDGKICATIINLAQNLELRIVAEGVETEMQFEFLKKHGCEYYQGYLFYKPMPVGEIGRLLNISETPSNYAYALQ
jgi:ammonium transporter, Amt family